jgi:hypothetical protein
MLDGNGATTTAAVATAASTASRTSTAPALKKNDELSRTVEVKSSPAPASNVGDDDDDDALPAPGKVWDNSGPSLSELVKQQSKLAEQSSNVEAVNANDFDAVMSKLRSAIHQKSPGIDGWLVHAKYLGVRDGIAVIRYSSEQAVAAAALDRNGKREIIQSELSSVLGETVGVKFEVEQIDVSASVETSPAPARIPVRREIARASPVPPPEAAAPSIRITAELREQLRNSEPLIKTLMDELGAEIVKVE